MTATKEAQKEKFLIIPLIIVSGLSVYFLNEASIAHHQNVPAQIGNVPNH
ncbi:MAG: hypothetical protein NTY70_19555 [Burkholderiales bacterium]|nr:hypothetical protein [Burkholderiales bacterium]